MVRRGFLFLSLCLSLPLAAEETPRFASFTLENDFFAGYDRHYTNGLQLAFVARPNLVLAIGQRIYTPVNTDLAVPDPADRPYAGWLYGMADIQMPTRETTDHVTITLGMVGPASLARQTQDAFHQVTNTQPVRGWDYQVRNRAAVTVGYERAWASLLQGRIGALRHDTSIRAGATVGNVLTYANLGAVWRIGTALPADWPATHISLGPPRDGFRGAPGMKGWYVWVGADARAVARNVFIEGSTYHDQPRVDRRNTGYDMQVGVAAVWPTMRVGFTFVERGREFEGQGSPDRFGQLAISLPY